ncbi:recombination regulator RecX [Gammaproteobacteria bacterium]|nr:recombination regulator RecX [Gammaproteobacteria bacterium]
MADIKPPDVRRAAMDLLARREHSRHEILVKLTRRFGDNPELFEQEIRKLTDEGLQSDSRLAEAFIRARTNRGQGPLKIKMELRAKQVGDELISIAFEECGIDFVALARLVAFKKFGDELVRATETKSLDKESLDGDSQDSGSQDSGSQDSGSQDRETLDREGLDIGNLDMKCKARISRFMQQRGFSYEHISSLY